MKPRNRNSKRGIRRNGKKKNQASNALVHDNKMPVPMLIPVTREIRIQLRGYCGAAANGAGVLAGAIPFDPSATLSATFGSAALFPEWTNYVNLYQNVKVVQFEVQMVRVYTDDTKGDTPEPLVMAGSSAPALVVPSTFQQVVDNGDSQIWPVVQDYSGKSRYHSVRMSQLTWAITSTPNPGTSSGIGAGCPGSIIIFGNGYAANAGICSIKYTGTYKLRTRV